MFNCKPNYFFSKFLDMLSSIKALTNINLISELLCPYFLVTVLNTKVTYAYLQLIEHIFLNMFYLLKTCFLTLSMIILLPLLHQMTLPSHVLPLVVLQCTPINSCPNHSLHNNSCTHRSSNSTDICHSYSMHDHNSTWDITLHEFVFLFCHLL